jgi:uncharacterized protein (TIGR02145 family)
MRIIIIIIAIILFFIGLPELKAQTLKDIDGNSYKIVTIGRQIWMAENLKTIKYLNGDTIEKTIPATLDVSNESTPRYQWAYGGEESYVATYGRLYTWYAATDCRNICPAGWHVPTDTEWTALTDYLINNGYGSKALKSEIAKSMAGTSGWKSNSIDGNVGNDQMRNNSTGFTALATGYRYGNGSYNGIESYSYWWTATETDSTNAWYRCLSDQRNDVYRDNSNKKNGISVRCLKDE